MRTLVMLEQFQEMLEWHALGDRLDKYSAMMMELPQKFDHALTLMAESHARLPLQGTRIRSASWTAQLVSRRDCFAPRSCSSCAVVTPSRGFSHWWGVGGQGQRHCLRSTRGAIAAGCKSRLRGALSKFPSLQGEEILKIKGVYGINDWFAWARWPPS